jgi:TPR repeat protein
MDAGIDMIRATQSTPANKLSPARAPRFPSLISDLLISQCEINVDELEKQETDLRAALTRAAAKGGNREAAGRLRNELTSVGRQHAKLEVCIATILESKRLAQFAKYCSGRNCDREAVWEEINRQRFAGISRPMAEQGDAVGQYNLGVAYATGQSAPRNYTEAAKWYRLAADQGYAPAQYNLGHLYANGLGVWPDYTEAAKWYRLAADQGNAAAQYALGFLYTNGQGVPRDYVRARMWLNLSATKGNPNAKKARDAVAQLMSSGQIAEAEKLAREWKPPKQPRAEDSRR